ncbi:MAG: hypothetical protein K8S15_10460 [Candidatus Aegiribacteria sp.]|nr:hypothetical protein [Candidatus Aegiribacteria sp.]
MSEVPNKTESRANWSLGMSILALVVSIIAGIYFPYFLEDRELSLLTSGFSYITHTTIENDSTITNILACDLTFTNNGNRTEVVLSTKFVLPFFLNFCEFAGFYWNVQYQQVQLPPFSIKPGEKLVFRLEQLIDDNAILGPSINNPGYTGFGFNLANRIIALEVLLVGQYGVPQFNVIPIAGAFLNPNTSNLSWRLFSSFDDFYSYGGVTLTRNLLDTEHFAWEYFPKRDAPYIQNNTLVH